jgi:hypothetical protein
MSVEDLKKSNPELLGSNDKTELFEIRKELQGLLNRLDIYINQKLYKYKYKKCK